MTEMLIPEPIRGNASKVVPVPEKPSCRDNEAVKGDSAHTVAHAVKDCSNDKLYYI
jgi:hypothetical protein